MTGSRPPAVCYPLHVNNQKFYIAARNHDTVTTPAYSTQPYTIQVPHGGAKPGRAKPMPKPGASQAGHGVAVASLALAGAGAREWSLLTLGTLMMAARTCRTYGTRRTHRTPW